MSRREAWLTVALVFAVALVARAVYATTLAFPKPEDTAYYVGVARNLVEGRGLVTDAIWSYHTPPLVFPKPAFEIWLPLPAFLSAIPIALLGGPSPLALDAAFRTAQIPFVLVSALVPVLAWRLALDVAAECGRPPGRARMLALGTGLTSAVSMPLLLHAALPDSTMPFAAIVLAACLLMTRVLRHPAGARLRDPRVEGIGLLLGLGALTRNEAGLLALIWVGLVIVMPGSVLGDRPWAARARLVGVAAAVSLLVYAPWALRNWSEFGTPLPGQAISNALSVYGTDIFAWNHEPTLARHLAMGPAWLLEVRLAGLWHNLGSVLLLAGLPVSLVGVLALPWQGRGRALRPLLVYSLVAFLVTGLVFPVATTWGTFLHAGGAVHVLLIVSALGALDALIVRAGRWRGWTRPVTWLGPAFGVSSALLFSVLLLPSFTSGTVATARTYESLAARMAAVGEPFRPDQPVIHDFTVWLAEHERIPALALPHESPADVLDLAAAFPGTRLVVLLDGPTSPLTAALAGGGPAAACFEPVDLGTANDPADAAALEGVAVYRITCRVPTGYGRTGTTDPSRYHATRLHSAP